MNRKELKEKVNRVIDMAEDDEVAHGAEDDLHIEIIEAFCPIWVIKEVNRLSDADFSRWCA